MPSNSVLVVAAHPDDEVLGCGGTIARHSREGDAVTVVIVCEGESLRYGPGGVNQGEDIRAAADVLGVEEIHRLDFPDQRLDDFSLSEIIEPLVRVVEETRPRVVYTQYGGDYNRDHEAVFDAVEVATRPTVSSIRRVYAYHTPSSTEWAYPRTFVPDTWVDISATLDTKLEAMACYESELRDYPHPRSLEALEDRMKTWGSEACLEAAEVFMTVRSVVRAEDAVEPNEIP